MQRDTSDCTRIEASMQRDHSEQTTGHTDIRIKTRSAEQEQEAQGKQRQAEPQREARSATS